MIKFIYGEDAYRSGQKIKQIIDDYKKSHKNRIILSYFDCSAEFEKFKDEFRNFSIFGENKILVLTNFFSETSDEKDILSFLKNKKEIEKSGDLILFYGEGKSQKGKSLLNFLKKQTDSQEFNLLKGRELTDWIKVELKKHKTEADAEVLEGLANFSGNDLWRISNEIKKLVLYRAGKSDKKISKKDFDLLVFSRFEPLIFETIDAISARNKKKALALLHNHLEKGDPPFYIFSMIKFQFRNLLMIKDLIERGKSFSSLKIHPFVLKKGCQLSRQFDLSQLKKIYKKIFQLDLKIKTGNIEPILAMDILISEI